MQTIIGVSYGGEFGGHEKAAVDLLVEMRRHTKVEMLCDWSNHRLIDYCCVNGIAARTYARRIELVQYLWRLGSEHQVIHMPGNLFIGSFEGFLSLISGKRSSVYIPYYLDHLKLNANHVVGFLKNLIQYLCLRLHTSVITISKTSKEAILKVKPDSDVYLVSNKVPDFEQFQGESNIEFDCLLIGRIYFKQKGQDRAIRYLERFSSAKGKRLSVAIAGDGVDDNRLDEMLTQADCNDYIKIGYCDDTGELYSKSKVVLVPSHFEGVPFVILEALSFQRALVVSDIPVFRELIGESHTLDFDSDNFSILESALSPDFRPLTLEDVGLEVYNETEKYINETSLR